MDHPKCFDSQQQYDEWHNVATSVYHYKHDRVTPYCVDCTPEYAARMREAGRCEHPDVIFYRCGTSVIGRPAVPDGRRYGKQQFEKELAWEQIDGQNKQDVPYEAVTGAHA